MRISDWSSDVCSSDLGEGLRRPFSEVVANAGDQIPPPRDRTAVQDFEIGRLGRAVDTLAFAAQPDAVDVGADPAQGLPADTRAFFVRVSYIQPVEQPERMHRIVVDGVTGDLGKGGGANGGRARWNRF